MPMYNLLEYSDSNSIHQKVGRITIETKLMRLMLTLLRMGFLGLVTDGGGVKRPSPDPKMCHTYLALMKLGTDIPYPKKIQKIYESRDTHLELC